jgi:hypothetical protein
MSTMNIRCRHHLNICNLDLHRQDLNFHSTRTETDQWTLDAHRIAT